MSIGDLLWLFFMLYQFMSLFPQPTRTRPSVEYVPVPYRGRHGGGGSPSGQ